ncbi:MAG TPA: sugar phosphate isomerase/epimerase [Phycisphaerae bacterium]|nr:sugar phosphate isomerase/epimerase [Phycisphaerae bacterium]HOJ75204.1 sugar phosphate isomerase/epimerase [Phycisphaerae bacterium]HOM52445.1 sugar phosphate isomerase/epimerase [Phycisphaerae bacterium]HOQ86571.1 sugar phosphate isomerase/epimerase [Phycisphaerae bacterium]HPP27719.1 sugar phosphate isomerase/epimerase [Phycisphaerae bacterium]
MRIGFMTTHDPERIAFARSNGFGCVELIVKPDTPYLPGKDGWQDRAAQMEADFDAAGLRISCVAGFYVNHMDADPQVAAAHAEQTRRTILLAEFLGVPTVAGFSGRVVGEDLEASLPRFKQIWSEHARFAADHGVRIAFEHCPMGRFHSPFGGINCICTPAMWDRCFDAVPSDALGLEWDPSHLVCMQIDPVANARRYGSKVFHVHAKDAKVNRDAVARFGLYHEGATEHCFPGLGDTNWGAVIKELRRAGYDGDLNIEGWHDDVFQNHDNGPQLEDLGLLIAKRHLEPFVDGV